MHDSSHYRRMTRMSVMALCLGVVATGGRPAALTDGALLGALRHGGYVLVMRHAHSPGKPPDRGAAQPDNVKIERELDQAGRDSAHAMGRAILELKIPIGNIESSPTYRALETIKLAGVGEPKIEPELGEGGPGVDADADATRAAWLRQRVTQGPRAGTNALLVTHAPNMTQAFGEEAPDIGDGETLVFRPDGKGAASLVGRIKIGDWTNLNRKTP